jgi:hypothetical protein
MGRLGEQCDRRTLIIADWLHRTFLHILRWAGSSWLGSPVRLLLEPCRLGLDTSLFISSLSLHFRE